MDGGERTTWPVRGAVRGLDSHLGRLPATVAGAPWVPPAATRFHRHQAAPARPHPGARASTRVAVHASAMALPATLQGGNTQEDGSTNLGLPHVGGLARTGGAPSIYRGTTGVVAQQVGTAPGTRHQRGRGTIVAPHSGNCLLAVGATVATRAHKAQLGAGAVGTGECCRCCSGENSCDDRWEEETASRLTSPMARDAGAKYRALRAVWRSYREYNAGNETWCAVRHLTSSTVCSKYAGAGDLYALSWRSCARWLNQASRFRTTPCMMTDEERGGRSLLQPRCWRASHRWG